MTIQEAKKLIRKAHFSADKPLDSLDLAVEKIYAELFGITEQMEAKLKAKDERIAELEAMAQKMKCCMNCDGQGDREDNYYCFLEDCDDNLSLWRLKDNK